MSKEFTLKRGINLGGWLSQCNHTKERYDTFITEKDIERIASWKIDHVRVPFDYELIETEDGQPILENYSYFDNCIEWCRKYGLNIILDMHKAPGYSFNDAYTESNTLFNHEPLQKRFINLWTELAKRYGKYSDMVAFELLNEIVEVSLSEPWNELSYKTITEIRKFAPETKIIVGGINWNSIHAVELLSEPYDENIIYNFHCYEPLIFTHQKAYWVPELKDSKEYHYPLSVDELYEQSKVLSKDHLMTLKKSGLNPESKNIFIDLFRPAVEFAKSRNVPLYCGEYGVIDKAPLQDTVNWYKEINAAFEEFNIGRAAWSYKEMDFGIIDEHYSPIFTQLIDLL